MKRIRIAVLIGLLAVAAAWAGEKEAVKKDLALLQGEWSRVSGSADGHPHPEHTLKQMKRICKGDETTTTWRGEMFLKARFTIDPSKKPKTIDYQITDGFSKGQRAFGIYEVDGYTFKACFGAPGAERPTDFTTRPGDGRSIAVWKREKKPALPPEQK